MVQAVSFFPELTIYAVKGDEIMKASDFVQGLRSHRFAHVFNPYLDRCEAWDVSDAPERRAKLLESMLDVAIGVNIEALWIGRDLGHKGGRRTGMALTDEVRFVDHARRWGISADRPTLGEAVEEQTAKVIWKVLAQLNEPIFLWNVFPFHPHKPQRPFTNRSHTADERRVGEEILIRLVRMLNPTRLIGVGRDAGRTVQQFRHEHDVFQIRHPSHGGKKEFLSQISDIYQVDF